ncbi:MAG: serine hydrolase [Patescibacteria group bacterium]
MLRETKKSCTQKSSWVNFFFSLQPVYKPGERFSYSTAGVVVLGELIARASRMRLDQFADLYLFENLGFTDYSYARTPVGEIDAGGHLKISPFDFAKIGLLVLQHGLWNGQRIVSEGRSSKINEPAIMVSGASSTGPFMGYLWWQEPVVNGEVRSFQTRGKGGQFLIAVPSEDLLGVFTGSSFNSNKQLQPFFFDEKLFDSSVSAIELHLTLFST